MEKAANFYTRNMSAMRLRELQTWTEIARERNMIVVTGGQGDLKDMGALLGMIIERTPTTEQLDEATLRTIVREELIDLTTGRRVNADTGSSSNRRLSKGERQEDQEVP